MCATVRPDAKQGDMSLLLPTAPEGATVRPDDKLRTMSLLLSTALKRRDR